MKFGFDQVALQNVLHLQPWLQVLHQDGSQVQLHLQPRRVYRWEDVHFRCGRPDDLPRPVGWLRRLGDTPGRYP